MTRPPFAWLAVVVTSCALAAADEPNTGGREAPDRAGLEKQFQETLTGATLVGHFTMTGQDAGKGLKEERYTINSVKKTQGDKWVFSARVKYGDHDVSVPIPLEVKWAGDTPIITLTDLKIPLLGTYTARVIIYGGQYAGTWSGGDHGGHLFGKIVKTGAKEKGGEDK